MKAEKVTEETEQKKFDEENKPKPPQPPQAGRGRARGGRNRGGGRGRRNRGGAANNPIVIREATPVLHVNAVGHRPIIVDDTPEVADEITIGDDDDDDDEESNPFLSSDSMEDSDNSDDSDYVRGDDDAYYGGYGHCFRCGSRGHWANGCPYR